MYLSKKLILAVVLGVFCFSCNAPKKEKKDLVAIDSLLDGQIVSLVSLETTLSKEALVDGKKEDVVLEIRDSISWAHELDVFRQLGLVNNPIYFDKYKIEYGLPDEQSNLRILSITTNENLPITSLKVYYQDVPEKIRRVEGTYAESNAIFSGARNLSLEFQDFQGQLVLVKYSVEGGQKMMLADSTTYTIEGVISYQ